MSLRGSVSRGGFWDGDRTRELLGNNGRALFNFDGQKAIEAVGVRPNPLDDGSILMVADWISRLGLDVAVESRPRGRAGDGLRPV